MLTLIDRKADTTSIKTTKTSCYHCGEPCESTTTVQFNGGHEVLNFCCQGCKMVYEILQASDLTQFYTIEKQAGISLKDKHLPQFNYLEDATIVEKLIDFRNEDFTKATFYIPQIHCASCIWLLENLYKLNEAILQSKVNFLKKELYVTFTHSITSYQEIVSLLASIGYEPAINLSDLDKPKAKVADKRFYFQLGVAGFAFGNIMLLSLPEYFGLAESAFQQMFGYLNILLILPVVFYSSQDYLRSAWLGLTQKQLNIDIPIALGILTLCSRSVYEILTHTGAGYLDSLAGLVFFLLIGKWFQQITYQQLSFERDYKSYFPIATTILKNGVEKTIALSKLSVGDIIILRHGELIPADGILQKGKAQIDYSFVTGESEPIKKKVGAKLFAGGRQMNGVIRMTITKKVTQSYLTQLWNEDTFQKGRDETTTTSELANIIGKYFTVVILGIAFLTLIYWLPKDIPTAINAFTAVLIIACPCAVALSIPFTLGNALRLLGRAGFYLKNTLVIERLMPIGSVVFDKTGTLTKTNDSKVVYHGKKLTKKEQRAIRTLVHQSTHPISRQIEDYFSGVPYTNKEIIDFQEIMGEGLVGRIGNLNIVIKKIKLNNTGHSNKKGTTILINGVQKGYFSHHNSYRSGLAYLLGKWVSDFQLYLLSGDNDHEKTFLEKWFFKGHLHFQQNPKEKLQFIQNLQSDGQRVLMLGDGLNDAGALRQADVGIVIAEDTNNFTPACDAILDARQFRQLPAFIKYARQSIKVVFAAYGLAFIYNIIGLSFAIQGTLSPVIAAILMPLSSITIVVFGVSMTYFLRPDKNHPNT